MNSKHITAKRKNILKAATGFLFSGTIIFGNLFFAGQGAFAAAADSPCEAKTGTPPVPVSRVNGKCKCPGAPLVPTRMTEVSNATTTEQPGLCRQYCKATGFTEGMKGSYGEFTEPCCCWRGNLLPTVEFRKAEPLNNPLGTYSVREIAGRFIKGFLGLIGVIALLMFVFGGGQMMLSQGDKTKYQKGQETLVWAVIGVLVILGSYAVVDFIIKSLLNAK